MLDGVAWDRIEVDGTDAVVLWTLHLLVFVTILFPLVALNMGGVLITTGLSVWCLMKRDYGESDDGGANLRPALNVIYGLVLFQGVVFCYLYATRYVQKGLLNMVVDQYRKIHVRQ
ncbi:hypothetical protein E2562_022841 [Oryza meyeriana var. granulata]|uniref:Uncharacterized protein n=1 Tax=Oryza meyeriana var. granulata TaxID=110450 RepID=A0A6G1BNA7_9ORYZ|nr:hypothetical protein E2562_022841 [Oryza meyeriana var. granulata]